MADDAEPTPIYTVNTSFTWSESEGNVTFDELTFAVDLPCRTCGTVTRRIANGTEHTLEASCSEACDVPIQTMDKLRTIVGKDNS